MAPTKTTPLARTLRRVVEVARVRHQNDRELLERYTARRDEAAFAELVRRHGPRVLAACRAVLTDQADAEDAFQATFLVLLDKAGKVRWQDDVGGWLYAVAHRIAVRARARTLNRRRHEANAPAPADADRAADLSWREACALLHAELDRLPDKFRLPLVLCYLEGKSRDEAAAQLGLTTAAVKSRLERGRTALRERLRWRGVTLTAGLLAVVANSPAGAVPARLVQATLSAAAGPAPAAVAALVQGVTAIMILSKLKFVAGLSVVAMLIGTMIASSLPAPSAASAPPHAPAKEEPLTPLAAAKPPAADDKDSVAYGGRVLGPDGRPVPGAKLYLTRRMGYLKEPAPSPEYATTGPDGRFEFTVPRAKVGDYGTVVAAAAANHGVAWVEVPANGRRDDLTLRLVDDDVPISGQVVDLEGKPVPGATLQVLQINAAPGEDLGPWLEAAKAKKGLSLQLQHQYLPRYTIALSPTVTADSEGRFRLTGIGRNRLVTARLDGPTIASQHLHILTRAGETRTVTKYEGKPEYGDSRTVTTYYGASFKHAAAPTKPVVGVVRDRDTKKPLAGVTVRSYARAVGPGGFHVLDTVVRTATDAEGRYRLTGMPKGEGYTIAAVPDRDQPYLVAKKDVPDSPGLGPVTVDVELKRGVWIEGRITDKVTGEPLKGSVEYFALYNNPNLADYPGFDGTILGHGLGVRTKEDGSYRVVGLPGPGLVGVYYQKAPYLRAPHRDDEFGIKEPSLSTAPYHLLHPINYSALARVDPAKGVEAVKRDVTLDPGWRFTGTVLGPDGKPLAGARNCDLNSWRWWDRERMKTAEFTGWFNPRRPSDIIFQHPEKGLVGVAQPPKENGGSVTVRMEPGAAVAGRLVDADGRPRAGVELEVSFRPKGWGIWHGYSPERIQTDREGRFRIEALLPGYEFRLSDGKGELPFGGALRAGQTKDLGDVRMKRAEE